MSFIIKIYWYIIDAAGNSLDGQTYDTKELATAALAAWTANNTDPSVTGTVVSNSEPLVGFN